MQLDNKIRHIVDQLIVHYQPEKVILFGSAARGDATQDSDLDFFIIKKNVPHFGRDRYYELADSITYSHASDFLIYTPEEVQKRLMLGDPFIQEIMEEGVVLYG